MLKASEYNQETPQIRDLKSAAVKPQNILSSGVRFLTCAMRHHRETVETKYDETKKMTPNSQTIRAAVRSKAMVLLLLTLVYCYSHCRESVIVLCFVVGYFMLILFLQSS